MNASPLTKDDLVAAWHAIGIEAGDSLIVHSALRSLGEVEGGADVVLGSLLVAVGEGGNLMLPAFNYSRPLPQPHFDPQSTPARTGILAQRARLRPDAIRSLHPTHSVVVIGPDASTLTRDHLKVRAFGIGSPIDLLAQRGGKVLLIGVGQTSNSTLHVAEERARIPKAAAIEPLPVVQVLSTNGETFEHQLDTSPSCSAAFEAAALPLRTHGAIRDARIAGVLSQIMRGADVLKIIGALLQAQPDALLCNNPHCLTCPGTRRNLSRKN